MPDSELLKSLLEPLLEDFQHWLGRARTLLANEHIAFLSTDEQANLQARVEQALQEVNASQSLFQATGCQAGVDPAMMMQWHRVVAECWQVMIRFRLGESTPTETL